MHQDGGQNQARPPANFAMLSRSGGEFQQGSRLDGKFTEVALTWISHEDMGGAGPKEGGSGDFAGLKRLGKTLQCCHPESL